MWSWFRLLLVVFFFFLWFWFYKDADVIAHSVYSPGSQAVQEIAREFGSDILQDGAVVDRKKLGAIVFSDRQAMTVRA